MRRDKDECKMTVLYSNIQGLSRKKISLTDIIEETRTDVCLLAETMVRNAKVEGYKSITPGVSVGQNVCILKCGKVLNLKTVKIYEPNETINMIGIKMCINNNYVRIYTAHLKQQSTNTRDEIMAQFNEMKEACKEADRCNEKMLMVVDSNVHVGDVIPNCKDKQDWGGKMLMEMITRENMILLNRTDICKGVVTRIDPRNGNTSTIDLAICNKLMENDITMMVIDEEGEWKPTRYTSGKVTSTDHNTILVKLKIRKIRSQKTPKFRNLKNDENRTKYIELITNNTQLANCFNDQGNNINNEFMDFEKSMEEIINKAFRKRSNNKKVKKGVSADVKDLLNEERRIRKNVKENPARGKLLFEIQKKITAEIGKNMKNEMEIKVNRIVNGKNPASEVFKVRKNFNRSENCGFPLKDTKGNIKTSLDGISKIIHEHFVKVFDQIPVPDDEVWKKYWNNVIEIFHMIEKKTVIADTDEPKLEEISNIIKSLINNKSVLGEINNDLIKLGGKAMVKSVFKCISMCFNQNSIPDKFRIERMILLYKHKGELDNIDNYRGIFLRLAIVTIYQKWLYMKSAPILDAVGTSWAFGGRKQKSGREALLIVKLLQDHAKWSKARLIIKFLDVEKFYDTMNYHKALIVAYKNGLKDKVWSTYNVLNYKKKCIPETPLGKCKEVNVENVFVQGSSDAGLMAWNLMDEVNKRERDIFDPVITCEGIEIKNLLFVDDIVEFSRSLKDAVYSNINHDIFQKANRIKFKTSKCKLLIFNIDDEMENNSVLNNEVMEIKQQHTYLGTIVSANGERKEDFINRVKKTKSVVNEVVQICTNTEIAPVRLKFAQILINACVDNKVKYGCQFWDTLTLKQEEEIDKIKTSLWKRILQIPMSTPDAAIQHEFGVLDLSLEIKAEKVILCVEMLKRSDSNVEKQVLERMLEKNVDGFCSQVNTVIQEFGCKPIKQLIMIPDIRKYLRGVIVEGQKTKLMKKMMSLSKTDGMVCNFSFNGKAMLYLSKLKFRSAKVVFMLRARMFPTKENFNGRWENTECYFCNEAETDRHLFVCPGYYDITSGGIMYNEFFDKSQLEGEEIDKKADKLVKIYDRLSETKEM